LSTTRHRPRNLEAGKLCKTTTSQVLVTAPRTASSPKVLRPRHPEPRPPPLPPPAASLQATAGPGGRFPAPCSSIPRARGCLSGTLSLALLLSSSSHAALYRAGREAAQRWVRGKFKLATPINFCWCESPSRRKVGAGHGYPGASNGDALAYALAHALARALDLIPTIRCGSGLGSLPPGWPPRGGLCSCDPAMRQPVGPFPPPPSATSPSVVGPWPHTWGRPAAFPPTDAPMRAHSSTHTHKSSHFIIIFAQECHIPGYDDPKADVAPLLKRWLERKDRGRWQGSP